MEMWILGIITFCVGAFIGGWCVESYLASVNPKWRNRVRASDAYIFELLQTIKRLDTQIVELKEEYGGGKPVTSYDELAGGFPEVDNPKPVTGVKLIPTILSRETKEEGDDAN